MQPSGKLIFVIGPPRSGSSMTAAFLHVCGAWGRVNRSISTSGFHLNVVDKCLLLPGIERNSYLLDLAGTNLPGVPCPTEGLEVDNAVNRIYGVLTSLGWAGGTAVVRSHLALPFVPSLNRQFPDASFVFVYREPIDIVESVRRTGWLPLRNYASFWLDYTTRFNQEMRRFSEMPTVRGYSIHPQHLINGNTDEIRAISSAIGLAWNPAADELLATLRKDKSNERK